MPACSTMPSRRRETATLTRGHGPARRRPHRPAADRDPTRASAAIAKLTPAPLDFHPSSTASVRTGPAETTATTRESASARRAARGAGWAMGRDAGRRALRCCPGGSPSALSGLNEAGLVGEDDGLDAVAEAEFLQEARDMCLDGRVADDELLGDLGVGEAAREEPQDLELAGGQLGDRIGPGVGGRS